MLCYHCFTALLPLPWLPWKDEQNRSGQSQCPRIEGKEARGERQQCCSSAQRGVGATAPEMSSPCNPSIPRAFLGQLQRLPRELADPAKPSWSRGCAGGRELRSLCLHESSLTARDSWKPQHWWLAVMCCAAGNNSSDLAGTGHRWGSRSGPGARTLHALPWVMHPRDRSPLTGAGLALCDSGATPVQRGESGPAARARTAASPENVRFLLCLLSTACVRERFRGYLGALTAIPSSVQLLAHPA